MSMVETKGIETFYHDYGGGQPLVVLHGATADHQVWAEQLQPLTDDYRVITYDLRGHGKTGGSAHDRYTMEMYADDLAAFIDALDLDRPVVLGHSLGGMIGYAFADAYPEKLSALVTVGARTPNNFSTRERVFKGVNTHVMMPLMGNERIMRAAMWFMERLLRDNSTADLDALEAVRAGHACDDPELSADERAKIMAAAREYLEASWSWQLSGLPVLMLYGEDEPFIEPHADFLETELEDCRTAAIPEGSHNAHVDNPEFIRTELREFLTDVVSEREPAVTG
jgi:3-oxoadipate enol-lactonase